jgi:hypothetical protein
MYSQAEGYAQLTFYYLNGQSESFNIYDTDLINVANVTKVEVKPPVQQLRGEGIFPLAERLTALNRH